jgi:hypothetical protein
MLHDDHGNHHSGDHYFHMLCRTTRRNTLSNEKAINKKDLENGLTKFIPFRHQDLHLHPSFCVFPGQTYK